MVPIRLKGVIWFTSVARRLRYQTLDWPHFEVEIWRSQMIAIARILSRASGTEVDVETLKTIAMFCGVGLLVSLLFAAYGLDLSPGFF
jgi:hypothetical protein